MNDFIFFFLSFTLDLVKIIVLFYHLCENFYFQKKYMINHISYAIMIDVSALEN